MFYRLVIQNNPDGTLSGAAAYDTPTSDARPITAADLNGFMSDVDAAVLGQKEAMESAHAAALASKDAELAAQANTHAIALANLTDEHDAALAQAAANQAAAVEAAKLAIQINLDALVTAAEAAHASGDLDAVAAVIEQAKTYTTAARRTKIEAELAAAQAAAAEAAAKLAALG